jgi:uncharacterized protein (DUF1330 family)
MSAIRPNKAQFLELMEAPDEGPVTMLNLLKFKSDADGTGASGASEYAKYGDAAVQMVEARGGKVLWMGRADQILIGDPAEDWDSVLLVQYPSRAAFIDMVTNRDYRKANESREAGVERTVIVACTPKLDAADALVGDG